jgi:hypothetical protein
MRVRPLSGPSAIILLLSGCAGVAPQNEGNEARELTAVTLPGDVTNMGQIVYDESIGPVRFNANEKHGYLIVGKLGDQVVVRESMFTGNTNITSSLALFGPAAADGTFGTTAIATALNSGNPVILFTLTASGTYLLTLTGGSTIGAIYNISSRCNSGVTCRPNTASPMSFGRSRITQAAIDHGRYTPSQLFDVGDFLFEHEFSVAEGWGNGLFGQAPGGPGPAPNLRRIHNGKFGGPDSIACNRCHLQGGHDGAGDNPVNMLQDGDGVDPASALERNPRQMIGVGYLELLGAEMTRDLQGQLSQATAAQQSSGQSQTVKLSSKGVGFGTITVGAGGAVDFSSLQGVDSDLVVKPLGWKGRVATARRFVEGGFQVHLGMQTEPLIARHCASPIPAVVGTGPDCQDPDADGVKSEITEGQLTAMAVYTSLLQAPVRLDPEDPAKLARVRSGELLFNQIGCATCHASKLILNDATHQEVPDLTHAAALTFDLTVAGRTPQLSYDGDGVVPVQLFSDLKRHDMGTQLADSHATFGTFAANQFMTAPLWGVAATPPYLHDGRAPTLFAAIVAHGGEAAAAAAAFRALPGPSEAPNDQQQWIIEFLSTLGRDPAHLTD